MSDALRVLWLVAVWLALWGEVTAANVLSGAVVAGTVLVLFSRSRIGAAVVRPVAVVRFAAYFLVSLFRSSVVVARAVVRPKDRIETGIVALPLQGCSDAVATVIADAITLTPGTLTLEVRRNPLTLYVHVLDVRNVEAVQADVRTLEVLAVRAFGDADALEALGVDDMRSWRGR